jgi:hypothetical protein
MNADATSGRKKVTHTGTSRNGIFNLGILVADAVNHEGGAEWVEEQENSAICVYR